MKQNPKPNKRDEQRFARNLERNINRLCKQQPKQRVIPMRRRQSSYQPPDAA